MKKTDAIMTAAPKPAMTVITVRMDAASATAAGADKEAHEVPDKLDCIGMCAGQSCREGRSVSSIALTTPLLTDCLPLMLPRSSFKA